LARLRAGSKRSTSASWARKGSLFATRPTLFTYLADRARAEKMARDLFSAVGGGAVTIHIGRRYPLAEAAEAHRALEARDGRLTHPLAVSAPQPLLRQVLVAKSPRRLARPGRLCIGARPDGMRPVDANRRGRAF
jgi:hypothetical protein